MVDDGVCSSSRSGWFMGRTLAPGRENGGRAPNLLVFGMIKKVSDVVGDFTITMDELRAVARYVTESAEEVLPVFEEAEPGDSRPRMAIDAAWEFANGANRARRQRMTSLDAHRAAAEATTEAARLAAPCAGDAASAAYLHPISKATQVGHVLRVAASAARIAELRAGNDAAAAEKSIDRARRRATPVVIDVLSRYPKAPVSKGRVANLMIELDTALRAL